MRQVASSPRPSPPSYGEEGVVEAQPRWVCWLEPSDRQHARALRQLSDRPRGHRKRIAACQLEVTNERLLLLLDVIS